MSNEEVISKTEEEPLRTECPCFPQIQILQKQIRAILEMFPDHAWEFSLPELDSHVVEIDMTALQQTHPNSEDYYELAIGLPDGFRGRRGNTFWCDTKGLRWLIRSKLPFKLTSDTAQKKW